MKSLYIERSTGETRSGDWVAALDLEPPPERIVVGTGPGSFAGIRSALAFAQGYRLGSGCEVWGLPSPCAVAGAMAAAGEDVMSLAVVGDARQGKIWLQRFDGLEAAGEVFQVDREGLAAAVGAGRRVVSPDDRRLGEWLGEIFGERYLGLRLPTAAGLESYARAVPSALVAEPLPIYLNPAVRP